MRRRVLASRRKQRGIALMVAILLVAFATILAAAIGFKSAMAARRSSATLAMDQSLLIAEAAEALGGLRPARRSQGRQDRGLPGRSLGQPLGPVEVVPGIVLEAYVEDATGRFNLQQPHRRRQQGGSRRAREAREPDGACRRRDRSGPR